MSERTQQLRREFLVKHEDADSLVFDIATGIPLEAKYFSWDYYELPRRRAFGEFLRALMESHDHQAE